MTAGFKGRLRSGNKIQAFKSQFFARRAGHEQMADMNRIEGTAKEADAFHRAKLIMD